MYEVIDYKKYVDQIIIKKQLLEYNNKATMLTQRASEKIFAINFCRGDISKLTEEYNSLKYKYLIFNKDRSRKIKRRKELKSLIQRRTLELNKNEDTFKQLNSEIEQLNLYIQKIREQLKLDLGEEITEDNGVLTINDSEATSNIPFDDSKEVVVHCTDFFPRNKTIVNNYDGNKFCTMPTMYRGVKKLVKCLSHRHTVHFTRNGVVESTGDGMGQWDQPKYIIIDYFNPQKNHFISTGYSDSYIYGDFIFSDKPVLLIREDEYDNVPKDELINYDVIKYKGDYVKCLNNTLSLLGVHEHYLDPNNAGHYNSYEMACERSLNVRNATVNYLKNNTWDGKTTLTFNENDLFAMYEIANSISDSYEIFEYTFGNISISKIAEKYGIDIEFIKFMIGFGILKSNENYTFKDDDYLYSSIKKINNELVKISEQDNRTDFFEALFDFNFIKELYDKYLLCVINKNENESDKSFVGDMSCDELFKFENHNEAKAFFNKLKKHNINEPEVIVYLCEYGSHVKFYALDSDYDSDKFKDMDFAVKLSDTTLIEKDIIADKASDLLNKIIEFIKSVKSTKKENTSNLVSTIRK